MIELALFSSTTAFAMDAEGPALPCLRRLEARIAGQRRPDDQPRRAACALNDALCRAVLEKPDLSFALALARLDSLEHPAPLSRLHDRRAP